MDKLNCPNGIINWLIASVVDCNEIRKDIFFNFFLKKAFTE
jgi:hypothetical protein